MIFLSHQRVELEAGNKLKYKSAKGAEIDIMESAAHVTLSILHLGCSFGLDFCFHILLNLFPILLLSQAHQLWHFTYL